MSKPLRSPVVGYNHNLRYRGRVFHVQSEDSGPVNPHVFTHLFFEGTILSSKKIQYDAEVHEDAVKLSMQQLHKAMIRELTHGIHDERIGAFFAARGQEAFSEPAPRTAAAAPPGAPGVAAAGAPGVVAAGARLAGAPEPAPALDTAPLAAPMTPTAPAIIQVSGVVAGSLDSGPARRPAPISAPVATRPVVMVKPTNMKRPPMVFSSSADGVVVQRSTVVSVGGNGPAPSTPEPRPRIRTAAVIGDASAVSPPQATAPAVAPQPPPAATRAPVAQSSPSEKPFSDMVSDKSLDEVILEYLSDDNEPERR
jgi:hypothetical protein